MRERIRDQVPPSDFCNCKPTYELPNRDSRFLAGTKAATFFLFLRATQPLLRVR